MTVGSSSETWNLETVHLLALLRVCKCAMYLFMGYIYTTVVWLYCTSSCYVLMTAITSGKLFLTKQLIFVTVNPPPRGNLQPSLGVKNLTSITPNGWSQCNQPRCFLASLVHYSKFISANATSADNELDIHKSETFAPYSPCYMLMTVIYWCYFNNGVCTISSFLSETIIAEV